MLTCLWCKLGPKKQFLEVLPIFFRTTELQQKLLRLIESPNISQMKFRVLEIKKKVSVVLGAKFGPN